MQDSPQREPGRVLVSEQEPVRRTSISFAPHSPTPSSDSSRSVNSPLLIREDEEEDDPLLFPQFDDSAPESEEHDYYIPHDQHPLSPGRVVLLLTAPSLRLGAFAFPSVLNFNLSISIPCLLVSAVLSLFVRHLWVMLAHYVRKVTVEDIVSELTVKFGVGRRWRKVTKALVRTAGSAFRVILLMFYIRFSVKSLANLFPASPVAQPVIALLIFLLVAFSGSSATSITSTPIAFAALLSAICYVVWMGFLIRATIVKDTRVSESILSILQLNSHWNTLSTILFTFASFPPLSIYASLSTYRYPVQSVFDKKKKRNSFGALSSAATIITVALTFPLLFLVKPEHKAKHHISLGNPALDIAKSIAIVLSMPEILSTFPRILWPSNQTGIPRVLRSQLVPRIIIFALCTLASFLPPPPFSVLGVVLMVLTLLAFYLLPAALHILFHNLFRPSAIIVSPGQSNPFTPCNAESSQAGQVDSEGLRSLLQAKERRMQKRRLFRRLLWDLGAWLLILAAIVWLIGLIARWWWWW